MTLKAQRRHHVVRTAIKRDTVRGIWPIRPTARYMIVGRDGKVVRIGNAAQQPDGRFAVSELSAGAGTLFAAIFVDGNTVRPDIARLDLRN
jgi:hypothetical protein